MTEISIGMPARLKNSSKVAAVGPVFHVKGRKYFFSIGSAFDGGGDCHLVEVKTETGWETVGKRLAWGDDEKADFALIELDDSIVVVNCERGLVERRDNWELDPALEIPATLATYREQDGIVCIKGDVESREDLAKAEVNSEFEKDLLAVRFTGDREIRKTDAGAGVWSGEKLIGILWKPICRGRGRRYLLVTPILNFYQSLLWKMDQYISEHARDREPPSIFDAVVRARAAFEGKDIYSYKRSFA